MEKKSLILTSAIAFALLTSNVSFSAENNSDCFMKNCEAPFTKGMSDFHNKNRRELPHHLFMTKQLQNPKINLTDEQKAKADKIREFSRQKTKPLRREIHDLENKIWEIREDDNLSFEQKHEKIEPLKEQIYNLQEKSQKIIKEDIKEFRAILTEEQKQTLENFKKQHKGPDLKLTEEQKAKADKIRETSRKKIKPLRREIHNLENKIWEIKENDNLSFEQKREKIKPLEQQIFNLHENENKIREQDMIQFESLLTKEQQKLLEDFKKSHKPHRPHEKPMLPHKMK